MRKDYNLERRKYVIGGFIILIVAIYIIKLFELQVCDDKYKVNADTNAFLRKTLYPSRGLMYDRNGELVVFNQPAYDVVMIPRDVQPFDTADFCNTLQISRETFDKRMSDLKNPRKNPNYSLYSPQTFMTHLSAKDYGRLQEKLYRFPGFFIQKRVLRQYNYTAAANVLGNIREVNAREIEKDDYYRPGDYTGDLGVEKSYETYLRGQKGVEILIRDAFGKIKGKYDNGNQDIAPISGKDLKLSIDIKLQQYGERLMQNKIGAIVAIEPATGEVLALVSRPTYDPARGAHSRQKLQDALQRHPPQAALRPRNYGCLSSRLHFQAHTGTHSAPRGHCHAIYHVSLLSRIHLRSPQSGLSRTRLTYRIETRTADLMQLLFLLGFQAHARPPLQVWHHCRCI